MTTLKFPRETNEWVGPISVTQVDDNNQPTAFPVEYAVIPQHTRPSASDWHSPVVNPQPGHGTEFGVMITPVSDASFWVIFGRILASPETIVRDGYAVGIIERT